MAFHDKITASFELLRRLLFLVRPYGLGKAALVLAVMILQGLLQVAGVTSIFPFLALATNPEGFRSSDNGCSVCCRLWTTASCWAGRSTSPAPAVFASVCAWHCRCGEEYYLRLLKIAGLMFAAILATFSLDS